MVTGWFQPDIVREPDWPFGAVILIGYGSPSVAIHSVPWALSSPTACMPSISSTGSFFRSSGAARVVSENSLTEPSPAKLCAAGLSLGIISHLPSTAAAFSAPNDWANASPLT